MSELELIINEARDILEQGQPEVALNILNKSTDTNNGEAIFLKGEICFELQKWGDALNHFSQYLEQFPSDKKAESYCVIIQNILGFYHKDLYNP